MRIPFFWQLVNAMQTCPHPGGDKFVSIFFYKFDSVGQCLDRTEQDGAYLQKNLYTTEDNGA